MVDVIIPTYNSAAIIKASAGSIQAQTILDLRIIVVSDGSTDETGSIVARLAATDPWTILLEQPNCTQIAETLLPALETMFSASRRYCRRLVLGTATRLASKGRITAALTLVPAQLYPMVMANVILRSALPTSFYQAIRRVAGRDRPME